MRWYQDAAPFQESRWLYPPQRYVTKVISSLRHAAPDSVEDQSVGIEQNFVPLLMGYSFFSHNQAWSIIEACRLPRRW